MPKSKTRPTGNPLAAAYRETESALPHIIKAAELLKQSARDLDDINARKNFYAHVTRAIQTIANGECQNAEIAPAHDDCAAAIKAGAMSAFDLNTGICWPCYARHVLAGGVP